MNTYSPLACHPALNRIRNVIVSNTCLVAKWRLPTMVRSNYLTRGFLATFVVLGSLAGCNLPPTPTPTPTPAACDPADVCDDNDPCTTDICSDDVDENGNAVAVCSNENVDCGDNMCNPANGECVACLNDGHCDDGQWCNGDEFCGGNNACQAGFPRCTGTDQACNESTDSCETYCTSDGNCPDDGFFCNGDEF